MSKRKILFLMSLILAVVVFAWRSDDTLAQENITKGNAIVKENINNGAPVKGKVTRDDVAAYLGKTTPSERKAAANRARQIGLKPGNAGRFVQAPPPGDTR